MLTILTGHSGSGKTTKLLQTLCANGTSRPQVCIVPEQYSHEMERHLSAIGGPGTSMYAEVLSFTRLASRVFAQTGGLNIPQLDNGGRLLLMHRAVHSVEGVLTVYQRPSRRPSFLQQLLSTGEELKSYCITPEMLVDTAQRHEQNEKLRDLGLILGTYHALMAQRVSDRRDRLTRLDDALKTFPYLKGQDVYVDCFTDFTLQELHILEDILLQANSLTVSVTCCDPDRPSHHLAFQPALKTIYRLRRLALKHQIPCQTEYLHNPRQGCSPALIQLEQQYLQGKEVWPEPTPEIEIFTSERPFDQVEYAAGKLLTLVQERGWRWRDVGITVRSLDNWEEEILSVFHRYGIPVSLNRMTDILQKPVLSLVTSALNAVSGGYTYDDIFRYLKTGLTGIDTDQIDRLENYVLTWRIKGSQWSRKEAWSWHPRGYGYNLENNGQEAARQLVQELDTLRRQIIQPLEELKKSSGTTGRDHALALYRFMEQIGLQNRLETQSDLLTQRGDLNQAEEYAQLWDVLCDALEQCARLLDGDPMELTEFAQLFQLVLSQYKVGTIPVSLDRVIIGDAPRMAHKSLKCLMILGADDTAFPQISQPAGLLTDEDRRLLARESEDIAPTQDDRIAYELAVLYQLVALPTQKLIAGYSTHGVSGEEQRPSILIKRLEELFPGCTHTRTGQLLWDLRLTAPTPALEYLAETRDPEVLAALKDIPETAPGANRLERSFVTGRGNLSPDVVESLYSRNIRLSATRMDRIKKCHFSYFMEYGLEAKPRKKAEFSSLESGTFVHYILENLLKQLYAHGGLSRWGQGDLRDLTQSIIRRYIQNELGGLEDKPPRFRYLFGRLVKAVDRIVDNVIDELKNSDFQPRYFELEFGKGKSVPMEIQVGNLILSLNGKVDRIDTWEQDGKLYYRIVDYKTGVKQFSFTDIWNGLSLQMLVYNMALDKNGNRVLHADSAIPAGVLYLPARDALISGARDMDASALQSQVDSALKRSGLFLYDTQVIEAMDHSCGEDGQKRFLPISYNKDGSFSKKNLDYLATLEQMGQLNRHIEQILVDIGNEFRSGNVDADPYQHGTITPCDYCEFSAACHFEEGQKGSRRRYFSTLKSREFWDRLASSKV